MCAAESGSDPAVHACYGTARSLRARQNAEWLNLFLAAGVEVLPFESDDASVAGSLRRPLALAGTLIGPYDLLVATRALHHRITLVTANAVEFARVPGVNATSRTP